MHNTNIPCGSYASLSGETVRLLCEVCEMCVATPLECGSTRIALSVSIRGEGTVSLLKVNGRQEAVC